MKEKWYINALWGAFWRSPIFFIIYLLLAIPSKIYQPPAKDFSNIFRNENFSFEKLLFRLSDLSESTLDSCPFSVQVFEHSISAIDTIQLFITAPGDQYLSKLERTLSRAVIMAKKCDKGSDFLEILSRLSSFVKIQSKFWDLNEIESIQAVAAIQTMSEIYRLHLSQGSARITFKESVKTGDILLTRFPGHYNSVLARSGKLPADFSHVFITLIDDQPLFLTTLESQGGVALSLKEMNDLGVHHWVLLRPAFKSGQMANKQKLDVNLKILKDRIENGKLRYSYGLEIISNKYMHSAGVAFSQFSQVDFTPVTFENEFRLEGSYTLLSKLGVVNDQAVLPSDFAWSPFFEEIDRNGIPPINEILIFEKIFSNPYYGYGLSYSFWKLPMIRIERGFEEVINLFITQKKARKRSSHILFEEVYSSEFQLGIHFLERKINEFQKLNKRPPDIWDIYEMI